MVLKGEGERGRSTSGGRVARKACSGFPLVVYKICLFVCLLLLLTMFIIVCIHCYYGHRLARGVSTKSCFSINLRFFFFVCISPL